MSTLALIFAGLAGLLHVFFFYLESIAWTQPQTWKRFGLKSQDEADLVRPMALNQGFYNLFLAIGVVAGWLVANGATEVGDGPGGVQTSEALMIFVLAMMLGAALVLVISNAKMWRAALIQGLFPALALLFIVI